MFSPISAQLVRRRAFAVSWRGRERLLCAVFGAVGGKIGTPDFAFLLALANVFESAATAKAAATDIFPTRFDGLDNLGCDLDFLPLSFPRIPY